MAKSDLDQPVQYLKGVGPRRAEAFGKLGVRTVRDLLRHAPHRYLDATTVTPIAKLAPGMDVTAIGEVVSKGVIPTRRGLRLFQAVIRDSSGLIDPSTTFLLKRVFPTPSLIPTDRNLSLITFKISSARSSLSANIL